MYVCYVIHLEVMRLQKRFYYINSSDKSHMDLFPWVFRQWITRIWARKIASNYFRKCNIRVDCQDIITTRVDTQEQRCCQIDTHPFNNLPIPALAYFINSKHPLRETGASLIANHFLDKFFKNTKHFAFKLWLAGKNFISGATFLNSLNIGIFI